MPVRLIANPYHPTQDDAVLRDSWTPEELSAAALATARPVTSKARRGTQRHADLLAAGAVVYQECPPLSLDAGSDAVRDWCARHTLLPVVDLRDMDVDDLWARFYEIGHRGWSPTAPVDRLRELFAGLVTGIDRDRSTACVLDGQVVAACFVFADDDPLDLLVIDASD